MLTDRFSSYQKTGERMLYVLELSKGIFIDARRRGGVARYINHSCVPNCTMDRWKVRGVTRMCVFTTRAIEEGEELTFDYKWERLKGRPLTKCYCGAEGCRGFLETEAVKIFEETDGEGRRKGDWRKLRGGEEGEVSCKRERERDDGR